MHQTSARACVHRLATTLKEALEGWATGKLAHLPDVPGIYLVVCRSSLQRGIGQTRTSIRARVRAQLRELQAGHHNHVMAAAAEQFGLDSFAFAALEVLVTAPGHDGSWRRIDLNMRELAWAHRLQTLTEPCGFNLVAGGHHSAATRLRHRERLLLRASPPGYSRLPGIASTSPVAPALLISMESHHGVR